MPSDRVDVADAFTVCFDQLQGLRPSASDLDAWQADRGFATARSAVAVAVGPDATLPRAALPTEPAQLLGALRALDDRLASSRGRLPLHPGQRAEAVLRRRYMATGKLNTDATGGAVLPRRVRGGRPASGPGSLGDVFDTLRVPAAHWDLIAFLRVPPLHDHVTGADGTLSVGSVPMLSGLGDLSMTSTSSGARRVYVAAPAAALRDRVPQALKALAAAAPDLALIPEITLDDDLLARWQAACPSAGADVPTWILAGTGPVTTAGSTAPRRSRGRAAGGSLPANRAVLVHGPTGQVVGTQDKQAGFSIPPASLADYGLDSAPAEVHDEGLTTGSALTVFESRAGRFAILICEDLSRLITLAPTVVAVGVSHVLVPILAPPIMRHRWEERSAGSIVTEEGATVLVVNSIALGREVAGTPASTLLVVEVPDTGAYSPKVNGYANPDALAQPAEVDAVTVRVARIKAR